MREKNMKKLKQVKDYVKMQKINLFDIAFIFIIMIFLILGFIRTIILPKEINYYENRPANKFSDIKIKDFMNGELQNKLELALADQIPFSQRMKKYYNFCSNKIADKMFNLCIKEYFNNQYFNVGGILRFGTEGNLVFYQRNLVDEKDNLDIKINNINQISQKYSNLELYIYYIEKDTDIYFPTNEKSDLAEYILENTNIPEDHKGKLAINSFNEFKEFFYKTDHHWNYKGSYNAYVQILKMIKPTEEPLKPLETIKLSDNFSGSKASRAGVNDIYKEPFYVYRFELPIHDTYVNNNKKEYGHNNSIASIQDDNEISYGMFYGGDEGEVIFDYNNPEAENILIFGESYDNAVIELLASHFNKTYCVDLRAYEMDIGKKFNFNEYIENNNISKVVFIGNIDFYVMEQFLVEVK